MIFDEPTEFRIAEVALFDSNVTVTPKRRERATRRQHCRRYQIQFFHRLSHSGALAPPGEVFPVRCLRLLYA